MLSVRLCRCIAVVVLCVAALTVPVKQVCADAIAAKQAMTAATLVEIFIEEGEVRVELETGVPDLVTFNRVFPDEFRVRMGLASEPDDERFRRFFAEDCVVRADDGPPLPGKVVSFETRQRTVIDEITGEPHPSDSGVGPPVVFVVFSYPFDGRPESLTFDLPTEGEDFAGATIGVMAYHQGQPVMGYHLVDGRETLDLDWSNPTSSRIRGSDLRGRFDSPLHVYLYVEPFEVRIEIVARLRDLQRWTDLGVEGLETIPVAIQTDLENQVAEFLVGELDLALDGVVARPVLDRIDFVEWRLRRSGPIEPRRELDAESASMRAVYYWSTQGYPHQATLLWKLFPEGVERVEGATTDVAGSLPVVLTPGDRQLCWRHSTAIPAPRSLVEVWPVPTDFGRVAMWVSWLTLGVVAVMLLGFGARAAGGAVPWPTVGVIALVAAGLAVGSRIATRSSLINEARTTEVVSALLSNVYHALDFRDEARVQEILAQSVGPDLAGSVSEIRSGFAPADQGHSWARVHAIDLNEVTMMDSDGGIAARCSWNVVSIVGHWGHIHRRIDPLVADLHINEVDGVWKITSWEFLTGTRSGSSGEV